MTTATENTCTETYLTELEGDPLDPTGGEGPAEEPVDAEEAKTALAALTPTLKAIPSSEVRLLRVGTTTAVGIGLAYARAFSEDRDRFVQALNPDEFDPVEHDNLAERAKAFWRADIQMRQELGSEGSLRFLLAEAKPLRVRMTKAATYLWGEDGDLGEVVGEIRRGQGHANHADDLGALAELFSEHWDEADGKCDVTLEDIARAETLGAEILELLSPSKAKEIDDARNLRNRAAEHLRRGIENIRDAASYVFRNEPALIERYPSLFVHTRKRKTNGKGNDEVNPDSTVIPPTGEQEGPEPSAPSLAGPDDVTEPYIPAL